MSNLRMFYDQSFPPAPKFTEADVPDLSGKVIVVTGGNTGIGKETVRVVLEHGAKVYMACRSAEKAEAVISELKRQTGKTELYFVPLDLSSFVSIKKAAEELKSKETKLDILFNNAGVMAPPLDQLTEEGYDMTFGTNVVGPHLFTKLLFPLLQAAGSEHGDARVIFTSSLGHAAAPKEFIAWETLKPGKKGTPGDKKRRSLGTGGLYYQSKCVSVNIARLSTRNNLEDVVQGVIMEANEWASRHGSQGIISCSLHPGAIQSELGRHWPRWQNAIMGFLMNLKPAALGAITQIYAGTSPDGKELNGKYLIPWARVGNPRKDVLDKKQSAKLWDWLEEQTAPFANS